MHLPWDEPGPAPGMGLGLGRAHALSGRAAKGPGLARPMEGTSLLRVYSYISLYIIFYPVHFLKWIIGNPAYPVYFDKGFGVRSSKMERGCNADGTRMERGWNLDGTRMERGWNEDGTRMEQDGMQMERGWHPNSQIYNNSGDK